MTWRRIGLVAGFTAATWVGVALGLALSIAVDYKRLRRATRRAEAARAAR